MVKVKVIQAKPVMSDAKITSQKGAYFRSYHTLLTTDTDVKLPSGHYLCRLRKRVIPPHLSKLGWDNYHQVGFARSVNRGNAGGNVDSKGSKHYRTFERGSKAIYERDQREVNSGIMGYMDSPNWRSPCRQTAFTKHHFAQYQHGLPFIKRISQLYQRLMPEAYHRQLAEAKKSKYHIPGTVFSTVTVNANFRTALHKDKGDYREGFGNLTVVQHGKYQGGYTLFPQYGIAIDLRQGDFLAMDVHQWHCNSPIVKQSKDAVRLSFVCYLRDRMHKCPRLDRLLAGQKGVSTQKKLEDMMRGPYTKRTLGKGRFGHNWYTMESPRSKITYKNKQYTVIDKKTHKTWDNLTQAYFDYINSRKAGK